MCRALRTPVLRQVTSPFKIRSEYHPCYGQQGMIDWTASEADAHQFFFDFFPMLSASLFCCAQQTGMGADAVPSTLRREGRDDASTALCIKMHRCLLRSPSGPLGGRGVHCPRAAHCHVLWLCATTLLPMQRSTRDHCTTALSALTVANQLLRRARHEAK